MRRYTSHDPNQFTLDFEAQVDQFIDTKNSLFEAASQPQERPAESGQCEMEDCIEIAAAVKRTLRESGMSRDQLVDGINAYFGRTEEGAEADPPTCRRPLTIHMMNNYLSKPCEYPLPAYMLYAIHSVTGIIEPGATIIAAAGAQVATAEEVRLLKLGQLEETLDELRSLRKQLKGNRR